MAFFVTLLALLTPNHVAADDPDVKPLVQNADPVVGNTVVGDTVDSGLSPLNTRPQRTTDLVAPESANNSNNRRSTQPTVSAAQAAARVRQLHGGRVLSVNASRLGDTVGYKVRVLVDGGRVKTVYVKSGTARSEDATKSRSSQRPAARSGQRSGSRSRVRTIGDG